MTLAEWICYFAFHAFLGYLVFAFRKDWDAADNFDETESIDF